MIVRKFVAVASLCGAAALVLAGPAYAQDNAPEPTKNGCELAIPGGSIVYPHGTVVTATVDGQTDKYKCDDGTWVKVKRLAPITKHDPSAVSGNALTY